MKSGDLILVPFSFADIDVKKIRPAVILGFTQGQFQDLIICTVSSNVPLKLGHFELAINKSETNELKANSIIKVDRVVTIRSSQVLKNLGILTKDQLELLRKRFIELIQK